MKIAGIFVSLLAVVGCSSLVGRASQTGHFIVRVTDNVGNPVTNATVIVKTLNCTGLAAGAHQSHYNRTSATANTNGVVDVCFQFLTSDFTWFLRTPSHYSGRFFTDMMSFSCQIVDSDYMDINTNTVDGLAKYNELKALYDAGDYIRYAAKFEPESVTYTTNVVCRDVGGFYPKRNPQPMYAYGEDDDIALPIGHDEVASNGYTVVRYPTVVVDIERHKSQVFDGGTNWYQQADFVLEEFKVVTNGIKTIFGKIMFAPGCGAYKARMTQNESFPSTYEADPNAVYEAEFPFSASFDVATGRVLSQVRLIDHDEYLVLRTRRESMEGGSDIGFHYSKILAPVRIGSSISFRQSVFNPRLNDPNLEFDMDRNLARPKYEVLLP